MKKTIVLFLALGFFQGARFTSSQPAERDLSRYDSIGPFELNFTGELKYWGERSARVREFLWTHWRKKELAVAAIKYTSREGVPHPVFYFVEPSSNGEWNIVIEAHRCAPGEEPTERRSVAVVVQRIVPRSDSLQPEVPIPDATIVESERYELVFKDREGKTVNIL